METADGVQGSFELDSFLAELDSIFAAQQGLTRAEPHLLGGLDKARALGDGGAQLSILNELIGLYRSQGKHTRSEDASKEALALVSSLGLDGSDAHATTLINVATADRAAGRLIDAEDRYRHALAVARSTMNPADRRLAALHNNLSLLLSETGRHRRALDELLAALEILRHSSKDLSRDIDIAGTYSNLALLCLDLGLDEQARQHADAALVIFGSGGLGHEPHVAAALAAQAQVCMRLGAPQQAAQLYADALRIVATCYGTTSDAYAVTAGNLAQAERTAAALRRNNAPKPEGGEKPKAVPGRFTAGQGWVTNEPGEASAMKGLELSRRFWEAHGKPLIEERYPAFKGRIAVGLVGHGSECYGFDDLASRDHDFGPGFCIWLTPEDYFVIGDSLQADYEALPQEYMGVARSFTTERASGEGRRVGVFEIGDFFERITGHREAPPADRPHEWLALEEPTLAAATNGAVFADALGAFSSVRGAFRRMPDDVRLSHLARRLALMAQAGQYNVPRMLARGDGEAAWLAVGEFVRACASAVFLLNRPSVVGYLPYYKWQFLALRDLAARPAARLPQVVGELSAIVRLASAACLGGPTHPEGTHEVDPARQALTDAIEQVCEHVAVELRIQRLSDSPETFLEHHRAVVQSRIRDPWLRGL